MRILIISIIALLVSSCTENYHLNQQGSDATSVDLVVPETIEDSLDLAGSCFPSGSTVTISSDDFGSSTPGPFNCTCDSDETFDCGRANIPGTGPNGKKPRFRANIVDRNGNKNKRERSSSIPSSSSTLNLGCKTVVPSSGTFVPGIASTGTVAIPISDVTDSSISISIDQNGFSSSFDTDVNEGDTVIKIPLNYDGSGTAGSDISFAIESDSFDGSCTGVAHLLTPMELSFGERASIYVEDGNDSICAVQLDNDVYCWGRGVKSTQYNGGTGARELVLQTMPVGFTPAEVMPLEANGFALSADGDLVSWGEYERKAGFNSLGFVGTVGAYNPPTLLTFPTTEKVRILMGEHTEACTIMQNNDLYCWGFNGVGELGIGVTGINRTPVFVRSNVADVIVGGTTHCINTFENKVYCTGSGIHGQRGDGTYDNSLVYEEVIGLSNVKTIHSVGQGGSFTKCAHKYDGTVWCWGHNGHGQLGNGDMPNNQNVPVQVNTLGSDVTKYRAGFTHSCALKNDKTLWCWGQNGRGQIGDGTVVSKDVPVQVPGLGDVVDFGLGQEHTCALNSLGKVYCWGRNRFARLGDGTTTDRLTPVEFGSAEVGFPSIDEIKVYREDTCALAGTDAYCVGANSGTSLAAPKLDLSL